jgi:hypothetical protein
MRGARFPRGGDKKSERNRRFSSSKSTLTYRIAKSMPALARDLP